MFGLNLSRAFELPKGSIQHAHYIQAAINNVSFKKVIKCSGVSC